MAEPSVALVGPGAIGTTVAAMLHEVGRPPTLYGRTARDELVLETESGRITVPGPVETDPSRVRQTVDLVFLAVKATQTAAAAPWLAALADQRTVVCVLQNGVEQLAATQPLAPASTVLPAVVWFPSQSLADGSVLLRGEPRLTVPATPGSEIVVAALAGTRCAVETATDFRTLAWRKLLQNAVAGLMVLTGRRAGMFRREDIAEVARGYVAEGLAVARAEGAVLGDGVVDDVVARFSDAPLDLGTSILTDRDAGRPLEWDVRNGVIRRLGRRHGIPTPISDLVVPLLSAASDGPG